MNKDVEKLQKKATKFLILGIVLILIGLFVSGFFVVIGAWTSIGSFVTLRGCFYASNCSKEENESNT